MKSIKTWIFLAFAVLMTSPLWSVAAMAQPTLKTGGI
tara:strand:+ start:3110 stop:3220 length:111 start_codon:yes stop_codon:yes gene_type:complete